MKLKFFDDFMTLFTVLSVILWRLWSALTEILCISLISLRKVFDSIDSMEMWGGKKKKKRGITFLKRKKTECENMGRGELTY